MSMGHESPIIVIGRGHSGTRILSQTLLAGGVHMGRFINMAGDKVPPDEMYDACRVLGQHVDWEGDLAWDFSRLHSMPIDPKFIEKVEAYLDDVISARNPLKGWKLPETTLAYPWIARMFPRAMFIYIVRDPRDCLLGPHRTDDLSDFGIPCAHHESLLDRRVESWKYQYDIVRATPRPRHFISVKYEDLVQDYERSIHALEDFLGIPLGRVVVDSTRVGRWSADPSLLGHVGPLEAAMRECGYS